MRIEIGEGYSPTAPTEKYVLFGSIEAWNGKKKPLVYCHGSGDSVSTIFTKTGQLALIKELAKEYIVMFSDLGLESWGNDTHVLRIKEATNYLLTRFKYDHSNTKVTLLPASMGGLGAMGFTRMYPWRVRAVAGVIPATDLQDLWANRGMAAAINAAYPGGYVDATHGPTHNPSLFADQIPSTIPIHLFTQSNDVLVVPSTAENFARKRSGTKITSAGALGHTEAAIAASIPFVTKWLRRST